MNLASFRVETKCWRRIGRFRCANIQTEIHKITKVQQNIFE